jgi:hypothetical protein
MSNIELDRCAVVAGGALLSACLSAVPQPLRLRHRPLESSQRRHFRSIQRCSLAHLRSCQSATMTHTRTFAGQFAFPNFCHSFISQLRSIY